MLSIKKIITKILNKLSSLDSTLNTATSNITAIQGDISDINDTFDDYLPLTGGTLSGDLRVNGKIIGGSHNVELGDNWPLVIGNGTSDSSLSNAMALNKSGDLKLNGRIGVNVGSGSLTGGYWLYGDVHSTYLTASQALTNSIASLNMATYIRRGSVFSLTDLGLIQCNFDGAVLVSGWVRFNSLTSGDRVTATIGLYRNSAYQAGSARPEFYGGGDGTIEYIAIPETPITIQNGDIIALRARNYTASRGNASHAVLTVRRI